MTKHFIALCAIAIALSITGCRDEKDTTQPAAALYDYAPSTKGHYVIYDVDSIVYKFLQPSTQLVDTHRYQVKELIQDTFYDNLGRLNARLELSRRLDSTQPFEDIWKVWNSYRSNLTYEKNEDDLRFTKLTFPPIAGSHWAGNQYLPASDTGATVYQVYAGWDYTYTTVNTPTTINGSRYDSTVSVSHVDKQNLIDRKLSREVYALHVGLVSKDFDVINKQDVTASWDAPYQANGFRIRMRIHSWK
jgi:hypothetical protein